MKEIERRFKLRPNEVPSGIVKKFQFIEQFYLTKEGERRLRLRKIIEGSVVEHFFTLKEGNGLSREEREVEISASSYDSIFTVFDEKPIRKVRTYFVHEGQMYIKDSFDDMDEVIIEVEFESVEEARAFEKPDWLKNEVTNKSIYSNFNIWKSINEKGNIDES